MTYFCILNAAFIIWRNLAFIFNYNYSKYENMKYKVYHSLTKCGEELLVNSTKKNKNFEEYLENIY